MPEAFELDMKAHFNRSAIYIALFRLFRLYFRLRTRHPTKCLQKLTGVVDSVMVSTGIVDSVVIGAGAVDSAVTGSDFCQFNLEFQSIKRYFCPNNFVRPDPRQCKGISRAETLEDTAETQKEFVFISSFGQQSLKLAN